MATEQQTVIIKDRTDFVRLFDQVKLPATKADIVRDVPDVEFIWADGDPVALKDAVAVLHPAEFVSAEELVDSLCSALQLAWREDAIENQEAIIQQNTDQ